MLDFLPTELLRAVFAHVRQSGWYGADIFPGAKQESSSGTVQSLEKISLSCFPTIIRGLSYQSE